MTPGSLLPTHMHARAYFHTIPPVSGLYLALPAVTASLTLAVFLGVGIFSTTLVANKLALKLPLILICTSDDEIQSKLDHPCTTEAIFHPQQSPLSYLVLDASATVLYHERNDAERQVDILGDTVLH